MPDSTTPATAKPTLHIEHEFDSEPTFVMRALGDGQEDEEIAAFPATLPYQLRRKLAEAVIAAYEADAQVDPVTKDFELGDGGAIEPPEDDGTIRRRDVHGNCEEIRCPGDDGWQEWADLFDFVLPRPEAE